MPTTESRSGAHRGVAVVLLLLAANLSLPVVAALLDGGSTEDLIVPIQLAVMAVVGAITGYLLLGPAGRGSSSRAVRWSVQSSASQPPSLASRSSRCCSDAAHA